MFFLRNFFGLDGNTISFWSSLSHPSFFQIWHVYVAGRRKAFLPRLELLQSTYVCISYAPFSCSHVHSFAFKFAGLSSAPNPKRVFFFWSSSDTYAIPPTNTYCTDISALTFSCFFIYFLFLGTSCITFLVDVPKTVCFASLPHCSKNYQCLKYYLMFNQSLTDTEKSFL